MYSAKNKDKNSDDTVKQIEQMSNYTGFIYIVCKFEINDFTWYKCIFWSKSQIEKKV